MFKFVDKTDRSSAQVSKTDTRIVEVTDDDFEEVIAGQVTVIDFHAHWCAPCRQFAPTFAHVATDTDDTVQFVRCNVDESPETAARYGVQSIPTVVLLDQSGAVRDRFSGVANSLQLRDFLVRNGADRVVRSAEQ